MMRRHDLQLVSVPILFTIVFALHFNFSSATSAVTAVLKDQLACTMCSTCFCQPILSPPPPSPPPPSESNCPPPPSPPSSGSYYYSPPPPYVPTSTYYSPPPPSGQVFPPPSGYNFPTPPPPNPIVPYFPFYYYNPPPSAVSSISSPSAKQSNVCHFLLLFLPIMLSIF